jgi:DTW domain-containing protein YfiP
MGNLPEDWEFGFDFTVLENVNERNKCLSCQKSIKYFCYNCVKADHFVLPEAKLPIPLIILKDSKEWNSKSTAIHAALLAPEDTTLVTLERPHMGTPKLPNMFDPSSSIVLFPSNDSLPVEEVEWNSVKNIIILDGTWAQANSLNNLLGIKELRRVHLSNQHQTLFWRYQNLGPNCLSTIEAIYYLYKEILALENNLPVSNLHNLLYLFVFFYQLIQNSYTSNTPKHYTSKHRSGYIKK